MSLEILEEKEIVIATAVLTSKVEEIGKQIERIMQYVTDGHKDHETRIRSTEKKINWAIGGGAAIGVVIGWAVGLSNALHSVFGYP